MVEDRDSERLTDVVDAVAGHDDDLGMRIGPGTEVGGYIIDGELGHGGMGVVYSATHPVIGKRAAIKILRIDVSRSPIAVERFIQEARAVNQIGHPNIIDIFAYGALPDGRAYHVMDLLVGESLRRRLKRSVLHPSEAASVIDEIASALTAAHDHGFVHRDLKPDNVFLVQHDGRWPEVKLLDFGLAKLMPEYGVPAFTTKTGVMLGTPEYMSPEQARGVGVDYRTDIYALGVVMFEILAGHRPFTQLGDPLATLLQHAEEPPAALADTVAGLPDEMNQLVDAMLAKTPEARPSLAAVRTVIKRLRTTQLPTRSVAGRALADYHPSAPPLGITPSRVGAEAVLPGDSLLSDPRLAHPQTTTRGVGVDAVWSRIAAPRPDGPSVVGLEPRPRSGSHPPGGSAPGLLASPRTSSSPPPGASTSGSAMPSADPRPRSSSHPPPATGDAARSSPSVPSHPYPDPARSSPSVPSHPYPDPARSSPGAPSSHPYPDPARSSPGAPRPSSGTQPPGSQAGDPPRSSPGGLPARPRSPSGPGPDASSSIPSTQRGVVAPIKPGAMPPAPTPPPASSASRGRTAWLAIAALLVAGGGVALAIALTGN